MLLDRRLLMGGVLDTRLGVLLDRRLLMGQVG